MIDPHESTTRSEQAPSEPANGIVPPPIRRITLDNQPTVALPPSQDAVAIANTSDRSLAAAGRPARGVAGPERMTISDLSVFHGDNHAVKHVSLPIRQGEVLALIGPSGCGKTTLLRMLAGETPIDSGELSLAKGTRLALHDQRPPRERSLTLRDYVLSGCTEAVALEAKLTELERKMGEGDQRAVDSYANVQARFELAGGYNWRDRVTDIVFGLGFHERDLGRSLDSFSGGEMTRGSLARALAGSPDVLLLDEPTNHLDIESLEWLEKTLVELDAAIILVAHDRWFLEAVGTCVLELEAGRSRFFSGPWHAWRTEQAAREIALGRSIQKQKLEIERMEKFVERFRAKASKAKQAQSRVKALDKMERVTEDPRDRRELGFKFSAPERSARVVFELEDGRLEVPGRTLLYDAALWLERGEHVSLVGPNGSGKTTLVRALTGEQELTAGQLRTGHKVSVGYLSQHGEELEWGGARTVLEAAVKRTGLTPNEARALLGRFLFPGSEVEKKVEVLSGGERRRLLLARMVATGANLLVLDEPVQGVDVAGQAELYRLISRLRERHGCGVLMV